MFKERLLQNQTLQRQDCGHIQTIHIAVWKMVSERHAPILYSAPSMCRTLHTDPYMCHLHKTFQVQWNLLPNVGSLVDGMVLIFYIVDQLGISRRRKAGIPCFKIK